MKSKTVLELGMRKDLLAILTGLRVFDVRSLRTLDQAIGNRMFGSWSKSAYRLHLVVEGSAVTSYSVPAYRRVGGFWIGNWLRLDGSMIDLTEMSNEDWTAHIWEVYNS